MPAMKFFKLTALPGSLEPDSMYFIAPAARPQFVEVYVTNAAGDASRRIIDSAQVQAMIDAAVASASGGGTVIVDDIAGRDALIPDNAQRVFVVDATEDPTVSSGGAEYMWRTSANAWVKLSETESQDLVLAWASLSGAPASTPANIDDAVSKRHSHANITELGKVGQDAEGNFTYDGDLPHIGWDGAGW